jgi:hypothetical protein
MSLKRTITFPPEFVLMIFLYFGTGFAFAKHTDFADYFSSLLQESRNADSCDPNALRAG